MNQEMSNNSLKLHLDFNHISSTIIPDISGNGYAGVIRNHDEKGVKLNQDKIYGIDFNTIYLPGGVNGGYIELPHGVLTNKNGLTICFWCKVISCQEHQTLLSFGQDCQIYVKLTPSREKTGFYCIPCVTNSGQSQEQAVQSKLTFHYGRWYQFCITLSPLSPAKLEFYVDARLVCEQLQNRVNSLDLSSEGSCLIGRGIYGTDQSNIELADFKIYQKVLTNSEVKGMFVAKDKECIQADREYLEQNLEKQVDKDMLLPPNGPYESAFSYESSDETFLSSTGHVHRPMSGELDAFVNLTVTITHNQTNEKNTYPIQIKALPSKEKILMLEENHLILSGLCHIDKDIILPTKGCYGSDIDWKSSNQQLISDSGKVFRKHLKEKETVILTATIRYEGLITRKEFKVIILPEYKRKQIKAVPDIEIDTVYGIAPILPSKVWVEYEDGLGEYEFVCWEEVCDEVYKSKEDYTITGWIKKHQDILVTAHIHVELHEKLPLPKVERFKSGQVKLLGDYILTENAGRDMNYLRLLDADRMLYSFRSTFGVDTKNAKPLGGWDEPLGLLRGHSTGHYLSAIAIAYAMTGDVDLKVKMDDMVHELRTLQMLSSGKASEFRTLCSKEDAAQSKWSKEPKEWGKGYLGAYSPDQFALLEEFTTYPTIWAPYYTMHKILAGLLDCYEYGQNLEAYTIATELGLWAYDRLSVCDAQQRAKMWSMYIAGEYGGMNESLSKLYLLTKDLRYQKAAAYFDNTKVFEGLAKNKDTITMLHANQHIPQMIGAIKEYDATGKIDYYRIGYYFWHLVTKHYAYSIGGVGRGENFKEPDILAGNIESDRNCETCASYNMLKLTHELYCYAPEKAEYFHYYERTLLNHIAASQNPIVTENMHHGVTYMLPIAPGQHKEYSNDYNDFTCCHGTGMENHVKYPESIYYVDHETDTLYVNLYLPSMLHWEDKGITVIQTGNFPGEKIFFNIKESVNVKITVCFRIPDWCQEEYSLILNGEMIKKTNQKSGYLTLKRQWEVNDILEIVLPYKVWLDYTPDDLNLPVASVMYGPFVMVAENDSKEWVTLTLSPDYNNDFKVEWQGNVPFLYYDDLKFVPMYKAHHINYHAYFKINIPYI